METASPVALEVVLAVEPALPVQLELSHLEEMLHALHAQEHVQLATQSLDFVPVATLEKDSTTEPALLAPLEHSPLEEQDLV